MHGDMTSLRILSHGCRTKSLFESKSDRVLIYVILYYTAVIVFMYRGILSLECIDSGSFKNMAVLYRLVQKTLTIYASII